MTLNEAINFLNLNGIMLEANNVHNKSAEVEFCELLANYLVQSKPGLEIVKNGNIYNICKVGDLIPEFSIKNYDDNTVENMRSHIDVELSFGRSVITFDVKLKRSKNGFPVELFRKAPKSWKSSKYVTPQGTLLTKSWGFDIKQKNDYIATKVSNGNTDIWKIIKTSDLINLTAAYLTEIGFKPDGTDLFTDKEKLKNVIQMHQISMYKMNSSQVEGYERYLVDYMLPYSNFTYNSLKEFLKDKLII